MRHSLIAETLAAIVVCGGVAGAVGIAWEALDMLAPSRYAPPAWIAWLITAMGAAIILAIAIEIVSDWRRRP